MPVRISAYVPCFNNAATVRRAVESILEQTLPPAETLVVDDGSTDRSVEELSGLDGVRIIRQNRNLGRGAVRARAMREARHEFVLCCDATNVLDPAFVEKALSWFDDPAVAAVFGRITQTPARGVAERWRGRHLFKLDTPLETRRGAALATGGAIVKAPAVASVGGYDARLRHTEDGDLGARLRAASHDVICDPRLEVICIASNTVADVLERHWRWYAGVDERTSWRGYWKNCGYAIKAMALADLRAGDLPSVAVSLATPHYQFWRSWVRHRGPT